MNNNDYKNSYQATKLPGLGHGVGKGSHEYKEAIDILKERDAKNNLDDTEYNNEMNIKEPALDISVKASLQQRGVYIEPKEFTYNHGITHPGIFHADDVFATALIKTLNPEFTFERTADIPADYEGIVYDIGMGEYDHHQEDNEIRESGKPYAAFGKLWRDYGVLLCDGDYSLADRVDRAFVSEIDYADNTGAFNSLSSVISNMNPSFNELDGNTVHDNDVLDKKFNIAVTFAQDFLINIIKNIEHEYNNEKTQKKNNDFLSMSQAKSVLEDEYMQDDLDEDIDDLDAESEFWTNISLQEKPSSLFSGKQSIQLAISTSPTPDELCTLALIKHYNPDIKFEVMSEDEINPEKPYLNFANENLSYDAPNIDVRRADIPYGMASALACIVSEPNAPLEAYRGEIIDLVTHFLQGMDYSAWNDCTNFDNLDKIYDSDELSDAIEIYNRILDDSIARGNSMFIAKQTVSKMLENMPENSKEVLSLEKFIPWKGSVKDFPDLKIVVYPSIRGGYAIECVPDNPKYGTLRAELPDKWRGKPAEELQKEIPSARMCHPSGYLMIVDKKDDIEKVVNAALEYTKNLSLKYDEQNIGWE